MTVRGQWGTNEGWNNEYSVNNLQYLTSGSIMTTFYTISNDGTTLLYNSTSGRYVKDITLEYIKPTE